MFTIVIKDNATAEVIMTLKTSLPIAPKDAGVTFNLVEFPDLELEIKHGRVDVGDVTAGMKDLNFNLKKSTMVTLSELKVITDRNALTIVASDENGVVNLLAGTFLQLGPYAQNAVAGPLPTTSLDGVVGVWSPTTISTATIGTAAYVFTPTNPNLPKTTMSVVTTA